MPVFKKVEDIFSICCNHTFPIVDHVTGIFKNIKKKLFTVLDCFSYRKQCKTSLNYKPLNARPSVTLYVLLCNSSTCIIVITVPSISTSFLYVWYYFTTLYLKLLKLTMQRPTRLYLRASSLT